jgi:hypothetical protein
LVIVAGALCSPGAGQAPLSNPTKPHPIPSPPVNTLPDANGIMLMKQNQTVKQNFDAVNALRTRQIQDESNKLLILAKDIKAQMDLLGDKPLPNRLVREAQVIELLAHDVQTKMTLSVGGG